ncbi:hypothetical protein SLH47_20105 [Cognatiyoonia sp. IB215182]|nr:hypothetical protein [Cognatiyoonia sp. IB215182]
MPDGRLADGMLKTARRLVPANAKRLSQSNLRRAISTSYYAVFHALAKLCADSLVGATKSRRPNKAWVEVYRGLDHGTSRQACDRAKKVAFPDELKDFADAYLQLQAARHEADYDPMVRPNKERALFYIRLAERSIAALNSVPSTDKKAFATWVLITSKGAETSRRRFLEGNYPNIGN